MPRTTRSAATRFDRVCRLAAALPGATRGATYGSPALKVDGRMFACVAIHRSAEPGTLAVRVAMADRDELVASDPQTFYLTPHYAPHPVVLVRLSRVHDDALRDLLGMGWRFTAKKGTRGRRQA